ncbi:MAG: YidC/Oxa1 family insertase periplasmic-domain containing protein [Gemmataceae bacterium]
MNNMRPRQLILFMVVCLVIVFGYNYVQKRFFPEPKVLSPAETAQAREVAGLLADAGGANSLGDLGRMAVNSEVQQNRGPFRELAKAQEEEKKKEALAKAQTQPKPKPKFEEQLIDLGSPAFNLQVRLTNRGGGVNRVIVTHFAPANEEGKRDLTRNSLHLVRSPDDRFPDELAWSQKTPDAAHSDGLPSFLMYHYAQPNELRPEADLGEREWKLLARPADADSESQSASYSTDLTEFGLRIIKTYTLTKGDYHVGLAVKIEKIPGATVLPLRYSMSTGHALPIEGKWFTGTYRNAYIGWLDADGQPQRHLDDAASIAQNAGGEKVKRNNNTFQYAVVANQYFASALCVDDRQENRNFIEFVRATAEGGYPEDKYMLGDFTARMISEELKVGDQPVEHRYLLYHGPVKVRLLHRMPAGEGAVADEVVDRYENALNLRTITDYHSDNMLGRFLDFIGWTWLTIKTTNFMHWLFGVLTEYIPTGIAILILTVLVRGALHPLSRRQMLTTMKFQEKMKKHAEPLKRLEEQYKGKDPQEFQQAKLKYMMANGMSPMTQMAGCLPMLLQLPIFMGLYYCLQENVFFRLSRFLWMDSLAAPDMLFRWGEIPFIGDPTALGSWHYLGPFFNLLPLIAVALMYVQQKYLTPPPTDEQQAMQQSMFKYMMIIMVVMFYKVASGLALYFIASSIWGIVERKLIPKPKLKEEAAESPPGKGGGPKGGKGGGPKGRGPTPPPKPDGLFSRLGDSISTTWKKLLDAAEKK